MELASMVIENMKNLHKVNFQGLDQNSGIHLLKMLAQLEYQESINSY